MSYPILFSASESAFDSNGIGILSDAISCIVTEERNGSYELEMQYPLKGMHASEISLRSIILAKPNTTDQSQPFRVYKITKPISGVITVYAQHISYDLSGIAVSPFEALNIAEALTELANHTVGTNPFTLTTDIIGESNFIVSKPSSYRSLMGGVEGSLLDCYGGEYSFDRYSIVLNSRRGSDTGVVIRYGKNLVSLDQEENNAQVFTHVYPYWRSDEEGIVESDPRLVPAIGSYNYQRIMMLDVTDKFEDKPTPADIYDYAQRYVENNDIGVPDVSLSISYQQDGTILDTVSLCDTVTVIFPDININATAKVIRTTYDVLLDRFSSVELGSPRSTFADTIAEQYEKVEDLSTFVTERNVTYLKQIVDTATESRNMHSDSIGRISVVEQNVEGISTEVSNQSSQLSTLQTASELMAAWQSIVDGKIATLQYVRAVNDYDNVLTIIIGSEDDTQTKVKIRRDRMLFSPTEDRDTSLENAIAYFSNDELFVRIANVIDQLQIGIAGDGNDWQWLKQSDGDLILRKV